jgi:ferredoxin
MWWRKKRPQQPAKVMRCSFCNKWPHDVRELIAGPGLFICDECVEVCNDVLAERRSSSAEARHPRSEEPIPWPNPIVCTLCHAVIRKDHGVVMPGNRGTLCVDCLSAIASQRAVDRD